MVAELFIAVDTASTVLALSKAAWRLESSFSKLDQDSKVVDTVVKNLAGDLKSLSHGCDLVHAELEGVIIKSDKGSPAPQSVDDRIWHCLAAEVEETSRTVHELDYYVKIITPEEFNLIDQAQRQRKLDQTENQIMNLKIKICRHTQNMGNMLILIKTVLAHIAPGRGDRESAKELKKLQDMVEKLQKSSKADPLSQLSHTEATLMQCAREVIVKGTTVYQECRPTEQFAKDRRAINGQVRVLEWVNLLESLRKDQRQLDPSETATYVPPMTSESEAHIVVTSTNSAQHMLQEPEFFDAVGDDSDDDLDTDLAKAAIDTGTKSFEAKEWEEANSLLQEALLILRQLSKRRRAFCDIFNLQYKLAICTYHIQEPAEAEEALMSVVQLSTSSDEQRGHVYNATHLLSLLYIRIGQVDRARSECEKVLQARRRLLEERKDAILKIVEESLGTKVEQLDSPSLPNRAISEYSDMTIEGIHNRLSISSFTPSMENRSYGPVSTKIPQSPAASLRQSHLPIQPISGGMDNQHSLIAKPLSLSRKPIESRARGKEKANTSSFSGQELLDTATLPSSQRSGAITTFENKTLSRKEILNRIGCQPKGGIEESGLLAVKTTEARPPRACNSVALCRALRYGAASLELKFNINEIPFGYSTSLTPLKFAIGARQVNMVEFLIANGAKPVEPDSWSTLGEQLMNRSWLMKTMSETEKEFTSSRIIAIFGILLKNGWNVNVPFEPSGKTVLHQAVTFWTGSYMWDLNLRTAVTSFLCEQGASPFQQNLEGKTAYDMASTSGHQDLLLVLDRGWKANVPTEPVELSA